MRRVVITGAGVLSPIGHDVDQCAAALKAGSTGIAPMPEWEHIADLQTRVGGKVTGIDLVAHFPRRRRRTQGTVGLYALYATDQAIAQAGLSEATLQSGRTGVAYGSTTGSSHELEAFCGPLFVNKTMRGLDSSSFFKFMAHTCAANLAATYGIKGRVLPLMSACTSGSQSIGAAYEAIRYGMQDVMLAGGAEELHYATAVTFDLLMATSIRYNDRPRETPRPFDAKRDGLAIGEGAASVVLEDYEHAKARGAKILAEIVSYGTNCDGVHLAAPSEAGMRAAMELALDGAKLRTSEIDYVNLHGTSTEIGDICESNATAALFGREVPASTQKSYTGHTLGACGAMELVFSLAMMRDGFLAANRNLEELDPRCGKLGYVRETTAFRPRIVMTNNFAFGGVNTSLIVRRVDD